MFQWFRRRLEMNGRKASPYDAVYGLPRQAVANWLRWNPQLDAEHWIRQRKMDHPGDETGNSGEKQFPNRL